MHVGYSSLGCVRPRRAGYGTCFEVIAMSGSFDVFLALHPFRDGVREFHILVRPLADLDGSVLEGVEGFYAQSIDLALVALRFHRRAAAEMGTDRVLSLVRRSGLPVIVLDALSADSRREFLFKYLSCCATYVQQYPTGGETTPIVERVVANLAGHLESIPAAPARWIDVERELPVMGVADARGGRRDVRRSPRIRLGSAS